MMPTSTWSHRKPNANPLRLKNPAYSASTFRTPLW